MPLDLEIKSIPRNASGGRVTSSETEKINKQIRRALRATSVLESVDKELSIRKSSIVFFIVLMFIMFI